MFTAIIFKLRTMNRFGILTGIIMVLSMNMLYAQNDWQEKMTSENVVIKSRWKESKRKNENKEAVLNLLIENNNSSPVNIKFKVSYFDVGVAKETSDEISVCIKSNKKAKGRKSGLCLSSSGKSMTDIGDEAFTWEIVDLVVEKTNACK